jgi:predicted fused transcriptional regulator/phosphomethylpyrimidine kinase
LLFFVILIFPAAAQEVRTISVVKGAIATDQPLEGNHLVATLTPVLTHNLLQRVYVGIDGNFEFHDVPPGSYTVEIATVNGDPIQMETVNLAAPGDRIEIRLPARANKPGAGGTVSVRDLQHPMTSKSKRIFGDAQKASEKGEYEKEIGILRSALNDAAAVPYVRMNIGVAYLRAGQAANAIPELQEAVRLIPESAVARTNFAYALLMTRRIDAAEVEGRRALQLDRNSAKARWVMGSILIVKGSHLDEAVEDLQLASREIPKARVILAQYYERSGQKDAAARELREFLPQASSDDRVKVQQWLNRLLAK